MRTNLQIKNIKEMGLVKDLFRKKNQINELLMFLLSIIICVDLVKLLNLKIKEVENKQCLTIDKNKTMPLNSEILDLIAQNINGRKFNEYLFLNARGVKIHRTHAFPSFKDICDELCFEQYSIISWRKTFVHRHYKKYNDLAYFMLFNQHLVCIAMKLINTEENMNLGYKEGVCL